jgi:exopolysaccharide biosynthesis polyprenyl glycosylphosphotransferase
VPVLKQQPRLVEAGLRALDLIALVLALWMANALAPASARPIWQLPSEGAFLFLATVLLLWTAASSIARHLGRSAIHHAAGLVRRRGYHSRRFAVVGQGDLAEEVVERFTTHPEWGYTFAGYILEDGAVPPERGSVLCRLGELGDLLQEQVLDEVVFAVPGDRLGTVQAAARLCEQQGITVQICLDLLRGGIARLESSDIGGLPTLAYSTVPSNHLALAVKRLFDVLLSATVLLLMAPVLFAVSVAIWWESPGPVLFRQRRVGLNGRAFDLFKFRSMNQGAEAQLAGLQSLNEATGPVFKMRRDPRVTRIGRFIRRTSLDEFPQFWNVLRGEMSIVGPRPPLPAEVRQYQGWQRRRLSVRPGITCTWQVSGRSEIPFDRWMELDLEYIDTWSLWSDLRIFSRTIPAVLAARGSR